MKKGKILITGAAGFIGTNIFEHLKNKGYDVYGVDFDMIDKKDERMFDINLIEDKRTEELFNTINPEFILHLAAFTGPQRNEENPDLAYKYNVDLLKVILKNLKASIPILFPVTDKIYIGHEFPNEKTELKPNNVHGQVKLKCEK